MKFLRKYRAIFLWSWLLVLRFRSINRIDLTHWVWSEFTCPIFHRRPEIYNYRLLGKVEHHQRNHFGVAYGLSHSHGFTDRHLKNTDEDAIVKTNSFACMRLPTCVNVEMTKPLLPATSGFIFFSNHISSIIFLLTPSTALFFFFSFLMKLT